ncbi:hypothetical protein [Actinacidiphila oryziradicis]|uniref:hypothetical protein n=1 Tax=Actinacidiphila oryziradicis TaxID=2571141 RepID=UPI0023F3E6F1|nr:hypothetical protein [Actinacidiphila oryziradicis]
MSERLPQFVVLGTWGTYSEARVGYDLRHAKKVQSGWKGRGADRIEIFEVDGLHEIASWVRPVEGT